MGAGLAGNPSIFRTLAAIVHAEPAVPGGTIAVYGEVPDAPLQLRITSLKREAEAEGHFLIERFVKFSGETTEARVENSFYNARTCRGTLHVESSFADRYLALAGSGEREPRDG